MRILVIGAGIGGLTAALALQKAGFRVSVYESAPELTELGAGLTLASNGSIVLQHLGLGRVLDEFACIPDHGAVQHFRDARLLVDVPHGAQTIQKFGAPYCQIHRADLHDGLIAAVRANDPDCIHLDHLFTDLSESNGEITAYFGNGQSATGDLLIGCDGIHSAVRTKLFGEEHPEYTGYTSWRGVIPIDALPDGLIEPSTAVFIGPGHFFTRYLIRSGELLNYVATARADTWAEEGWTVPSRVEEVQQEFAAFDTHVQTILSATPPDECFRWGIFERPPLPGWSVGRATLLGDAAHPISPFLGQGSVMALEDAVVVARCLESSGSIEEALERYELARKGRIEFVYVESQKAGRNLTTFDPDAYTSQTHKNEETLGLAGYNAVTVQI